MAHTVSTSVSSNPSQRKSTRRRDVRRTLIVTSSILVILLVVTVVLFKGSVSGTEFAPSHFQTREFSFYEIPFLHIQITPIHRKTSATPVARQIRTKGWISVPRGKKPSQWHIVTLNRGPTGTPAVASLLVDELAIGEANGPFWTTWNTDHPKRASVLWPVVQRLAERELYILVPELLQLARSLPGDDDAQKLSDEIDRWLVRNYSLMISDLRDAGRRTLAEEILKEARADYPDAAELESLDSTSAESPPSGTKSGESTDG